MSGGQIIFVCVYLALLVSYFFSETSGYFLRRAVNKIVMASMFLGYVIVETIRTDYGMYGLHALLLAAFVLAWLGDVLLLWSFTKGGIAFLISNLLFFVYLLFVAYRGGVAFSDYWWFLLVFAVLLGTLVALQVAKKINIKKIMFLYLATVTLHGSLSIALMFNISGVRMLLLGFGLALFMVSDYFLTVNKFIHKKNWVLRCNSGTYFVGMMLAALSLSF